MFSYGKKILPFRTGAYAPVPALRIDVCTLVSLFPQLTPILSFVTDKASCQRDNLTYP